MNQNGGVGVEHIRSISVPAKAPGTFSPFGNREPIDEGFEDIELRRRQSVEKCRIGVGGHVFSSDPIFAGWCKCLGGDL